MLASDRPSLDGMSAKQLEDEWLWCELRLQGPGLDEFDELNLHARMRAIRERLN